MRSSRAKNLAVAATFSSVLALSSSNVRNPAEDPDFERIFTRERAESVISGATPRTGKELLKEEVRPLLTEARIVRGDTPA